MKIRKITAIYFSPCGNAEKIAKTIADRIGALLNVPVVYDDFTLPQSRVDVRQFDTEEAVVFCVPVYAGRIPNKILPAVQSLFKGNKTIAIPVVTFGNRSYDNGLKELCFELDKNGFLTIGAAAVVAEHSFSNKLAPGRPDGEDVEQIISFSNEMVHKLKIFQQDSYIQENKGEYDDLFFAKAHERCPLDVHKIFLDIDTIPGQWPMETYYTPLGVDGKPAKFLKAKPVTKQEDCVGCGICAAHCPMGAIEAESPENVLGTCIKCQACIKKCPQKAKYFTDEAFLSHVKMLEENYARKTESSFFL